MEEVQRIFAGTHFTVRHTAAAAAEFAAHAHPAYTLTALLAGRMQAVIGGEEVTLGAGQTAFTNANQSHSAALTDGEFVSVSIMPALVNEMVTEIGLTRASSEIVFRSRSTRDDALTAMLGAIAGEVAQEKVGHKEMLESLVRQLVIHLLRAHLTVRKGAHLELSRAGLVDRRLRRAVEFMHDNYARELALEEIAAAAYLSEFHFARLFKQITGATPHAYLANIRIEKARRLLSETGIPVVEIAAMVGYHSQSHFTKLFKSVTGLTPRAYRESR